jgi:hypothetical protein
VGGKKVGGWALENDFAILELYYAVSVDNGLHSMGYHDNEWDLHFFNCD